MATVIDSLIVKLGLDTSGFDKGQKKVKDASRDTAKGFEDMAREATKFLAIIGGTAAITSFVQDVISSSAALERFSKNIGRNVEEVTAWSGAVEAAGGTAEGLQGTLSMLSKAQTEFKLTGNTSLLPFFNALGISAQEAGGSVTDLLSVIHNKIQARGIDRQTGFNLGQMFGIDAGTMNLLLSSDKEFKDLIAYQTKLNKLTEAQAKSFLNLQQGITRLGQQTEAFGTRLAADMAPAIGKVIDLFERFGEWCRDNGEFVNSFITILATGLGALALKALPITLTAAALVLLAGGLALLWDDYQTFKAGGDTLMPWDNWIPKLKEAYEWMTKVKEKLNEYGYNAVTKILGVVNSGIAALHGDRQGMVNAYNAGSGTYVPETATTGGDLASKLAAAEKAAGLPAGTLSAIMKQETGGNKAYIDDPAKYHYGLDAKGRRIAPHTGKVSTAFGPFGLLESTAADPGYGVAPLRNKSLDEQIRFAAQYTAARAKDSGSLAGGLAGYGEGGAYARSVLSGIPGASGAAMGGGVIASSGGARSVTTNVGEVKVYTQATDADGIVRDMAQSLDYLSVSQANTGQM